MAAVSPTVTTPSQKPPISTASSPVSTPTAAPASAPASAPRQPPAPSFDADIIHVPSYSRWFSWDNVHECEVRFLPEFFDSRSSSKNPKVYMYYRNSMIKRFRQNPAAKMTFTEVRKTLVGDVGSIRRVFDFLEAWGLINYTPSALNKPLKWDDKEAKSSPHSTASAATDSKPANRDISNSKRCCSSCKSICSIACFACEKYDLTLCARCYVRGNYQVGVSSSDFKRVEISEEVKSDWTERETLHLLEAIMHYGDDWRRVAHHVGGRSEKDCISQFIKLPFGEEFTAYSDLGEPYNKSNHRKDAECGLNSFGSSSPSKRTRLTPLADASNPIMAQAAFLSALAGVDIAEAAARAAVATLTEVEYGPSKGGYGSLARNIRQQVADSGVASNGETNLNALERACLDANSLLEKEELDMERAISRITEVEMKEIQDKIVHFEELDLRMEKEWQQLEQIKNLLFADQVSLLSHTNSLPKAGELKTGEHVEEAVKPENVKTD